MRHLLFALFVSLATLVPGRAWAGAKEDARRYFARGMALVDAGQYNEGIELLRKAYEIKPHPNVLFNIARAYTQKGDLDRAIEHFERYLENDPPDADSVRATLSDLGTRRRLRTLVDEGMRAIQAGRALEGIALLSRAYEERPHRNLLFNIARAYEGIDDYDRALATYQRYLETSPPDSADVKQRIARLRSHASGRAEKSTGRAKPGASPSTRKKPTRRGPEFRAQDARPSGPPSPVEEATESDAERAAKIAELVVERMRAEGLVSPPGTAVPHDLARHAAPKTQAGSSPGGEEDETELVVTDLGTVGSGTQPPDDGLALGARSSTTAGTGEGTAAVGMGQGVEGIEAKTGAVYEDVVVTASRRAQSPLDAPNAVTIITDEDIRLSGARTIPDLLRRVPGTDVMTMSFSDHNVAVRGFNRRLANKLLVLVDGRTVYQDFLGAAVWGTLTISLADIERIEVIRGPGSAVYGAYAYTGIVNIITKRPDQIRGSMTQVFAGNGRNVGGTFQYGDRRGPIGVRITGSYQRADKYELEYDPARVDYTTNVSNPNKSVDSLRLDAYGEYNLKKDTSRVFVGAGVWSGFNELYGVSSLRNQAFEGQEYHVRGGFEGELFSMRTFWTGLRVTSTPQFYRTGLDDLGSNVHSDVVSFEPILKPTLSLFGRHSLVLGGEYRYKFIDWDYLRGEEREHHFALFFQDEWTIAPELSVLLSGRLDLHPLIGPLGSPRAAVIYKPTPNQAFRATVGTAFRQPTMAETYLDLAASSPVAGAAIRLVGEPKLDPEHITTVDLGYLYQAEFGEFEAVAYLNRVSNLVTQTPLIPTGVDQTFDPSIGAFVAAESLYINDSRVFLALGTELSAHLYPLDGVDFGLSYALQYIFDEDTHERYTDSPLHKINAWGQVRTSLGLDFGLSAHFVSSEAWVEERFDPDDPSGFAPGKLPVDASVAVIGRVGYRLFRDQLELGISGVNLLDFGDLRHREHPFANRVEARLLATATARF